MAVATIGGGIGGTMISKPHLGRLFLVGVMVKRMEVGWKR